MKVHIEEFEILIEFDHGDVVIDYLDVQAIDIDDACVLFILDDNRAQIRFRLYEPTGVLIHNGFGSSLSFDVPEFELRNALDKVLPHFKEEFNI